MSDKPRLMEMASDDGAQYSATFEQLAVGIVHTSAGGAVRWVNRAFCMLTGFSRAEALRLHIGDLTHPRDLPASDLLRAGILATRDARYQRELRLRRKDGSYVWAAVTTSLVRRADGSPLHFISVVSDVSQLKRAEQRAQWFRAAVDTSLDAIFLVDPRAMRFLYANESACRSLGYSRETLLRKAPFEVLEKTEADLRKEYAEIIAAAERGVRTESGYVRGDGSVGWTELHRRAIPCAGNAVIVTIVRDITERKSQQERIERLSRLHAMLSGINATIVRIRDRQALFRECCRIACEAGGFEAVSICLIDERRMVGELVAWHGREESIEWLQQARFPLPVDPADDSTLMAEVLRTRKPTVTNDAQSDRRVRVREMTRSGVHSAVLLPLLVEDKIVSVMAIYSLVKGHFDEAEVKCLADLAADISFALEHLDKAERATHLALYDELTGLANRRLLSERLGQLLHAARHEESKLAVALLDVERLRSVNTVLGRRAGDALLRAVGERLAHYAGADLAARVSSNQFGVILLSVKDRGDAARMIDTLTRNCFAVPYAIDGTELKFGAKAGLALFPNDGMDSDALLASAEAALRKAKERGERHVFYTPDLGERTGTWLPLENKLGRALERGEFVLHYQPKVECATRRVVGLEALIRWESPDLGLVPPAKFIPLMEETGMIQEVGSWALQRAALDHRRWTEAGFGTLRVAVNISPVQVRQPGFVQWVQQAIHHGVTPAGIDLEMTESMVMEDIEMNIRKLREVTELGVQVAIDDFGTGYSSLAYLAKLPAQALKIDRSFVSAMLEDSAAHTLVHTIISLGHALGLTVIAEGVEEEAQARHLHLLQCDQIQGYLIGRPAPYEQVTSLLSSPLKSRQH